MVRFRYIILNTLHKGGDDDDYDRRNGGHDLVELEFTYNASIVGHCKYIKQGKNRLTN